MDNICKPVIFGILRKEKGNYSNVTTGEKEMECDLLRLFNVLSEVIYSTIVL